MVGDGLAWFASALAFVVAMSATPGPNNAMVTASGASWGFARTVPHMLGISIGFPLMLVAVAFGAGEMLRAYPWIHGALRWVGAAYLLWLAWRIATAEPATRDGGDPRGGRPLTFLQAALFQWVNPKAWIIAVGAVVTFTTAGHGDVLARALLLAVMFMAVTLPTTAMWTSVGVGAARLLRTRRALRVFNLMMAALLVVSLLPLVRGE